MSDFKSHDIKNQADLHPVVKQLLALVKKEKWESEFTQAIKKANSYKILFLQKQKIETYSDYIQWINKFLNWIPSENFEGKNVYDYLCCFYFIIDQSPVLKMQNKVIPADNAPGNLTPLSKWLVDYANAMGEWMDSPGSITPETEKSFYDSPGYNMSEYIRPRGGWKTFNQMFARNFKPGTRPVAAIGDPTVIVSPADSTFAGQWEIRPESHVTVKNLHWKISELMEGSPYKDRFAGGLFMHAFLGPTDYHRQHAPVGGKVLEARVIPGQVYLEVEARADGDNHVLKPRRPGSQHQTLDAPDSPGYQFAQARGLFVLETPIGLVAVLPIGMCQISSVVVTAEKGVTLQKGEEISYFQFGGSDIIVLFEQSSNVSFTAQPNVHHKVGTRIAQAFPAV